MSPSETEILEKIARGVPQKNVARECHLSESAVEKILRKFRKQFEVQTTIELVAVLQQLRLFPEQDNPVKKV